MQVPFAFYFKEASFMIYKVEITETLQKTVSIMAESEEEALREVGRAYRRGSIVLDDTNYVDTKYAIVEE